MSFTLCVKSSVIHTVHRQMHSISEVLKCLGVRGKEVESGFGMRLEKKVQKTPWRGQ